MKFILDGETYRHWDLLTDASVANVIFATF